MGRILSLFGRFALIASLALTFGLMGACDDDEAPKAGGRSVAKKKRQKHKDKKGSKSSFDGLQKAMWARLAETPTTCEGGANKRTVKAVQVKKTEPMSDRQYLKAHGTATINEKGPCDGKGTHEWTISMTFIRQGSDWRPASFGLEQKIKKR